ncbi:Gmad2 immunoglobulin-like domain-containing protein [Flavobacterium ardleyense]|uniref:Gmad2 immunoglobulin-like domain-containing protein n=1 Tax=Flavobacterium ardleyense TaxID=2038737 RepID=A0ABW5ZBI9_9FLAO
MKLKAIFLLVLCTLFACNNKKGDTKIDDNLPPLDTIQVEKPTDADVSSDKEFSNERFRKVVAEKLTDNKFRVQGEAQVFEATINWSVEDGHNVYDEGFTTASIGAPEWGKFDFTFEIKDANEIAVLNLILYEISAKDGNQTNVLLVPLK